MLILWEVPCTSERERSVNMNGSWLSELKPHAGEVREKGIMEE
jgi:hypothetical protein